MKTRTILVCILTAALTAGVFGDVVINEVQSSNGSTLLDEDGEYSDWIELLNRGAQSINLNGWALSDDGDVPMKWSLPPVILAPGARQIVFASGKDRTNVAQVAQIVSPIDVSGLVFWLKADDASYTNGAKVTGMADLSGNGNHAFTTNNMSCPSFRTNVVNGHSALRFTRTSAQSLFLPVTNFNGMASLRNVSLFVVCRWGGAVSSGLFGAWGSSANTHLEINSGGQLRWRVAAMDSVRSNGAVTVNAWCQLAGVMNSAGDIPTGYAYRNGVSCGSYAKDPGTAALSSYPYMAIGNSDTNTRFFDGDITEVLLFSRALTAIEREQVERYLALRYNLAYPGGATTPELHANFSLNASGEMLTFSEPGSNVVDAVDCPEIPIDAAYGRSPDGIGAFAYLAQPTPGATNALTAYLAPLDKPSFSRKRGICDAPFMLTLSHEDAAAEIYYTLDGSEPAPTNGVLYQAPISIATTTVVRAMAYKADALPCRAIATHTYLFIDDVLGQTSTPLGWPAKWGSFTNVSYSISTNVASAPGYTNSLRAALCAAPVLSLSLATERMFGTGGVYANPLVDGLEQIASAEWLTNGTSQTQIDCALRVQGAASRDFNNTPKKSLRLLFREAFGESRLESPVLAGGGTTLADFNTLVLRANYNNSWLHWDAGQRLRGISVHDQWVRDSQIAASGFGSHGSHVHLFINGRYWGLYNVAERTDAAFAANYFGGSREEYDAMTQDGIRDGDNVAWNAMVAVARTDLTTQTQYEALQQYLDMDAFIDYMIVNIYGSNEDWPANNWSAVRKRETGAGFRFLCWDAERTLEVTNANKTAISGSLTVAPNPASFYSALRTNAEFRLRFADRLHKHLFNDGALTPAAASTRLQALTNTVDTAIFGESARWGAYRNEIYDRGGPSPRYGYSHFANECARLLNTYFPVRTGVLLKQFLAANLYPAIAAPEFSQHGGTLAYGAKLSVVSTQGVAYVTMDGSDPRVAYAGGVAPSAFLYTGPFEVTNGCTIKMRALSNNVWSALSEAPFGVVLTEPVFLPTGDGDWDVPSNWLGSVVPQGAGVDVRIRTPAANRTVSLRSPVTIGRITFDHAANAFCDSVEGAAVHTLTFDGGASNACLRVTGDGPGWAEFDLSAHAILQTDLELAVEKTEGDEEYGALRLRGNWSGPGGLRKTGLGVATLTGETKSFLGAVVVSQGVLSVTGSAAPAQSGGVTVWPGGQLLLTSANSKGLPRTYAFGGVLTLGGLGRGPEIPDGSGQGKLGALRYDPGSSSNLCLLGNEIQLLDDVGVHVDGSQNQLALTGSLSGGARLVKSGAGQLTLPLGTVLTAAVEVASGTLAFEGEGTVGALSGAGALRIDSHVVRAQTLGGVAIQAVLREPEGASVSNGYVFAERLVGPLGSLTIYLAAEGSLFRGALLAPAGEDLAGVVREASRTVYVRDPGGVHVFAGEHWRALENAQVVTVPVRLGAGWGRIVEVRVGAAPASYTAWRDAAFPSLEDRLNAAVSGPLAAPFGDSVQNLMRYALGVPGGESMADQWPRLLLDEEGVTYTVPFDPGLDDVAVVVEFSDRLSAWSSPTPLFDSRTDYPSDWVDGWLRLRDNTRVASRFYRLRLIYVDE